MKRIIHSWFDATGKYSPYGERAPKSESSRCSLNFMRAAAAFYAGLLVAALACAAPSSVERFETTTWQRLQTELPRPSAVVFTATYCASCPAVVAKLANALETRGVRGDVVAVVIDPSEDSALLSSDHYVNATRLFAFEGNEAALRFQVDPKWRGVTPYTALLSASGEQTFTAGIPSDEEMAQWLGDERTDAIQPAAAAGRSGCGRPCTRDACCKGRAAASSWPRPSARFLHR